MNQLLKTNCQPISEESLEQAIDAICPTHGAYVARFIAPPIEGLNGVKTGCPKCSAERQAAEQARKEAEEARRRRCQVDDLRAKSGIPTRFSGSDFAGYHVSGQGQRIALAACKAYADGWPDRMAEGASLVLTGGPGTGKTHLACAIANTVIDLHLARVRFGTVAHMLRFIKDTYRRDSELSEQQAIDRLAAPDLLVLDEVGVQVGSDHEKMLMFEVLNSRYQECKPTILISNLNAADLEDFMGQRVMDRYRECGAVIGFDWPSHRRAA